ncbi:cyclin-D4-1-like [Mangifera indica]|uniref:cyclin-D4-1-like n=1 Tax=Mangifera indica TaxID=29780 RepID=UPI001CFB5D93|nr:cyclin-D4-1-like [Mangifera indica]XP_044489164.1 cyclin-D4-1-like [Mangifera indica]
MSLPSSHHSSSSSSSLYCSEDVSLMDLSSISYQPSATTTISPPPPSDDITISSFIDSEHHHMPLDDYRRRFRDHSLLVTARQDSIKWILKVHAYHHFRPVTAILSVNYFDRFLSSHSLPEASGWPFQLLSVACLSLAAKMEEPQVPLLLDLQMFEPRFVFEPRTVQRMELRVMSILNWRLNSVTPFHFLDYFISKLPTSSSTSFTRVYSSSSDLVLRTTRVVDFLGFPPSTIAAAAVTTAAGESLDLPAGIDERVNKEMVRSCHQLMEEYLIDTCPLAQFKDRRAEPQTSPPSPIGVLDAAACGSCDTRSENPGSSSQAAEAEPSAKRLRSSAPDVQQR